LALEVTVVSNMARVTVTQRARPEDRDALFTGLQWNDPKTADVNLLLQDLSVVETHRIKLGVSPVLRGVLSSLEARLDRRPCISLQEFHTDAVTCLLNFIYTGEVVLEKKSQIQEEFMKLCKTLRLNPSITKTQRIGGRSEVDSSDADNEEAVNVPVERQENTEVLRFEGDKDSAGAAKANAIRTDTLPLSSDRIEESQSLCDTLILENSDEETPEHISDFLSSIMSNPSQEGDGDELSDEQESTFTMPTSFDIPQEYISEMVPRASSTVSNPFQTSDEEYSENLTSDLQSKSEDRDFAFKKDESSEEQLYEYSEQNAREEDRKEEDTKLKREKVKVENVDKVLLGGKNEVAATSSTLEVKGEVEQITYQKSMGHKKFKEKKAHNPKMDRRTLQAKLFGESDSEGEGRKKERKKKEHEQKKVKGVENKGQSDSETSRQRLSESENSKKHAVHNPVETKEDLEQKKRRMKKKLKQAEAEQRRESEKSKVSKDSSKNKGEKKEKGEQRGSPQKGKKTDHECHSMCSCVKRALNAGEDDWLVPDTQVTYRTSSSDSDTPLPSPVKVLDRKPKKVNIGDSSTEDGDQDEDSADEEEQRKLEAERKVALALRGGGDVLSRMRGKLSVKIQNSPKFVVIDLWQYQNQLDASDTSGSDYRKPTAGDSDSDSGSDVSIPRGKRFSPVKASNEDKDGERKKKKKKLTKLKMDPPRKDFDIEDVEVWTPAMYQKWDKSGRPKEKKRKHKHDSDSDSKSKLKNMKTVGFNRSISFDVNKKSVSGEKILQRSTSSVPSLESLGIGHNYGMPGQMGKPSALSNLPKIPKLKKQENV